MYTIGAISKMMNLSISTLRYYDDIGLLIDVKRDDAGKRIFDTKDIEALNLIECLKNSGMKIKEIKDFMDLCKLGNETLNERLDFFKHQELVIEEQMVKLQKTMNMVKYKQWYYQTAVDNNDENIVKNMELKDMPEDIQELFMNTHHNIKELS